MNSATFQKQFKGKSKDEPRKLALRLWNIEMRMGERVDTKFETWWQLVPEFPKDPVVFRIKGETLESC